MTRLKKYAFIDRDGTILEEPEDKQIDSWDKFSFRPGAIDFLRSLKEKEFILILVTNQDGLGTPSYSQSIYDQINALMFRTLDSVGVTFAETYVCPHFESQSCECRKPKLGLLPQEMREGFFNREESFVVGDRETDIAFAQNLSIKGFNCSVLSWKEILGSMESSRSYQIDRVTNETNISVKIFRGKGGNEISTTIPFFDHMLDSLFRFSGFRVVIKGSGDTHIDEHHLIEDVAICLGEALRNAIADKKGITRFAQWTPMDESLSLIVLDLSNRPSFEFRGDFGRGSIGGVSTEMVHHFFKTMAETLRLSLHIEFRGLNTHHQCEAIFKGFGLALRRALRVRKGSGIPSTKGQL